MKYKCPNCGRYLKQKVIKATKELKERGYPNVFTEFICKKCGEISGSCIEVEE